MDAKLIVVDGTAKLQEIALELPAILGRGREASVQLPFPLISRKHCELYVSQGQLVVRDMGSLNGTFVNHQRVTEAFLPPGALLTVGQITFQAAYEVDPDAADMVPPPSSTDSQAGFAPAEEVEDFDMVEFDADETDAVEPADDAAAPPSEGDSDDDLDKFLNDL